MAPLLKPSVEQPARLPYRSDRQRMKETIGGAARRPPPLEHPHYLGYVINPASAIVDEDDGAVSFEVTDPDGVTKRLPPMWDVDPATLAKDFLNEDSAAFTLFANALGDLRGTPTLESGPEPSGNILYRTISPALQLGLTANLVGAPVDAMNALTRAIVDAPINLGRWAATGFEGEMPSERYASAEVPLGGSASIARGLEAVGRGAKQLREAADKAGATINIPLTPDFLGGYETGEFGLQELLRFFEFDMTPDESTRARRYISLIAQVAAGAPLEGALIAKLAVQLAKTTKSASKKAIYEAVSEMQRTDPVKAAGLETLMGTGAGVGMITSEAALDEYYPDAPQWMKNVIIAGGGLAFPLVGATVTNVAWDMGLQIPIIKHGLRFARGAIGSLTTAGSRKGAAHAIQVFGADWKTRSQILGVMEQLKLALHEGRNMDPATRIAYTLPQLARAEARILEAQLNDRLNSTSPPTEPEIAQARLEIAELRRFSAFQEGQLETIYGGPKIGAEVYAQYAERVMDRRNSIFEALDEAILLLDVGGVPYKPGPGKLSLDDDYAIGPPYVYTESRRRAISEGRGGTLDQDQTQAIKEAFEKVTSRLEEAKEQSLADAQVRAEEIRKSMPDDMGGQDLEDFNLMIRKELEASYMEMDGYEDKFWNTIQGMDRPKTDVYLSPDGADLGPQILLDGVPIGEFFAAKAAAVGPGEFPNQSKWLWKLAGREALVDQATKGSGPDAEKIAKQTLRVQHQETIVAQRQKAMDAASERLARDQKAPPESKELRAAREKLDELEASRNDPSFDALSDARKTNWEQQAAAARERLRAQEAAAADLPNPVVEKSQAAFEAAQGSFETAKGRLDEARGSLEITMGKGVEFEEVPINLAEEIADSSILGVAMVDGVPVGRTARDIYGVISELKREMAHEIGRGKNRRPAKIKAIGDMIDDLQRAIADRENFDLDTTQLDAAVQMTATKKAAFEKGGIGHLRGRTTAGESNIPLERTIEVIAPGSKAAGAQQAALRELETALTRVTAGEGTPFKWEVNDEGKRTLVFDSDFNLEKYATAPPPPFEKIQIGGRSLGFKVIDGTPATPQNIEIIQKTLWNQFKNFYDGSTFDTASAARWMNNNKSALAWLKKHTGETGFENLESAERIVKAITGAKIKDLDRIVAELRKTGAFNEAFTEEGFRFLMKEGARREANLVSAATILDNPSPLRLGPDFLKSYLGAKNPEQFLRETLQVLKGGVLPDGSNPALNGFKQAVAEALIQKGLTKPGGGEATLAGQEASLLSQKIGYDVTLWDPTALAGMAGREDYRTLFRMLYGDHAPEMLTKIAEGARYQSLISAAAQKGIVIQDQLSNEWAGNIGRILGSLVSRATGQLINQLWAAGAGSRISKSAMENIRGLTVDKMIVDLLMNPELGIAAITEFPRISPTAKMSIPKRLLLWAQSTFIDKNARRFKRWGQAPGALYEIGEPIRYEELDEAVPGPQTSVLPAQPRSRRAATTPIGSPIGSSILSQTNVLGPPPPAQGQVDPQRLAQLRDVGLPLFANKGGIVSIKRKPRQLVG